jgi:hypothetical protein
MSNEQCGGGAALTLFSPGIASKKRSGCPAALMQPVRSRAKKRDSGHLTTSRLSQKAPLLIVELGPPAISRRKWPDISGCSRFESYRKARALEQSLEAQACSIRRFPFRRFFPHNNISRRVLLLTRGPGASPTHHPCSKPCLLYTSCDMATLVSRNRSVTLFSLSYKVGQQRSRNAKSTSFLQPTSTLHSHSSQLKSSIWTSCRAQ